jgi:hypothetical protein
MHLSAAASQKWTGSSKKISNNPMVLLRKCICAVTESSMYVCLSSLLYLTGCKELYLYAHVVLHIPLISTMLC